MIKKDPPEVPEDFLDFKDIFHDINSPGVFIAQSDDDMVERLIVLDGHAAMMVFDSQTEDLKWEGISDIGSYVYKPDHIGDGVVLFPVNFYFEFDIDLADRKIGAIATIDAQNIEALTLPMKDVAIDDLITTLKQRLSNAFTSVLQQESKDLVTEEGKELVIPQKLRDKISINLALLGMDIQKVDVRTVEITVLESNEVVEKIYDEADIKQKMAAKESEKATKKKAKKEASAPKKEAAKKKVVAAPENRPTPPPPATNKGQVPSNVPKAPPSPSAVPAPSGPPPSTTPSAPMSVPTPSGPPKPVNVPAAKKAAAPGGGGGPPAPAPSPAPAPQKQRAKARPKSDLDNLEDEMMAELDEEEVELDHFIEPPVSVTTEKQVKATWFDRMIPRRAYELDLTITDQQVHARRSSTSIISGERKQEKTDSFSVSEDTLVTVRPIFPGCFVNPSEMEVDVESTKRLVFHVTPLIEKGDVDGTVQIFQGHMMLKEIDLPSKVITHRVSRVMEVTGAFFGILPALVAFFFNEPLSVVMKDRLTTFLPALVALGYFLPLGFGVLLIVIGGIFRMINKASTKSQSVPLGA